MDSESLKELLQSATFARSPQEPAAPLKDSRKGSMASQPFSKSLLASLLPVSNAQPSMERPSSASGVFPEGTGDRKPRSGSGSVQEIPLDAVSCNTTNISQVKHASHLSEYGSLVSATGHAIAYVLNDKKVRLIAQENAAMGLMEAHDASGLPIVDIAWNGQKSLALESAPGLRSHSSHMLASLSKGGEVRIGTVYADSNSSLVYDPLCAVTFPELSPARGLTWGGEWDSSLLAVFGGGSDIFIISLQDSSTKTYYVSTCIDSVEAVKFSENGSVLYVAGRDQVVSFSLSRLEKALPTSSIPLLPGVLRVWLMNHSEGVVAVALLSDKQLLVQPLFGDFAEILISVLLPGEDHDLFCQLDHITNVLCAGSHSSGRLIFVNLSRLDSPVVSIGSWPNEAGSVSVCASGQLHAVFAGSQASSDSDMFLYAYHKDSVKMHEFKVNWNKTVSAAEPDEFPAPSRNLLRMKCSDSPSPVAHSAPESRSNALNRSNPKGGSTSPQPSGGQFAGGSSKDFHSVTPVSSEVEQRTSIDSAALAKALKGTVKTVVQDSLRQEVEAAMKHSIPGIIQSLSTHVEQVSSQKLDPAFKKIMSTRSDAMVSSLEDRIVPTLAPVMEAALREATERVLLPGLQGIITDLIGQLSANISQAIVDASVEHHKVVLGELDALKGSIEALRIRAESLPTAEELTRSVRLSLSSGEQHVAGDSFAAMQSGIEALIREGQSLKALIDVLEKGNLQLLNWIIGIVDVTLLINDMSEQVVLSLIQQLGHDLSGQTALKLHWLEEIFTEFDMRSVKDPTLIQTMSSVFAEVFSNLRVLFAETAPSSPYYKQIKLVLRLVKNSMEA